MNIVGGSIVWDLDVDDKKFTAKLASASKGAKEFSSGLDKESKGASKALDNTGNSLDNISSKLLSIAKIAGGAFAVAKIINFGKEAINLAADLQKAQISLGIISERFDLSGESANKLAKSLGTELRIGTGAASEGLQNLIKQGFSLDQASDLLRRFTNEAITGKSSSIDLATAVQNLSFAYATGNSALGNMSGISENFSDIQDKGAKILAKWNGKAVEQGKITKDMATQFAELRDRMKKQGSTSEEITTALEKYAGMLELTNLTAGASAKFTGTYADNMLILQDKVNQLKTSLGLFLMDAFNPFLAKIVTAIPSVEQMQTVFSNVSTKLDEINKKIQPFTDAIFSMAKSIVETLNPAVSSLVDGFGAFASSVSFIADWLLNTAWPVISQVFGFIKNIAIDLATYFNIVFGPIIKDAIASLQVKFEEWNAKLIVIKDEIITAYDAFSAWFKDTFGKSIEETIRDILIWWGNEWSTKWVGNIKTIIDTIGFLIDKFSDLIGKLGEVKQGLKDAGPLGEALLKTGGTIFGGMNPLLGRMFADGVSNFSGGMALVGERGPELVNLPRGSDIYPAKQTSQMLGSGGATINIQEMIVRDDYDIDRFSEQIGFLVGIEPAIFEG
jgi:hypothetical protein